MKRIKMVLMEFKVHHGFFYHAAATSLYATLKLGNRESYLVIEIEEVIWKLIFIVKMK